MLKNLQNASTETAADIAARIASRREKWAPHPDAPVLGKVDEDGNPTGEYVARIVVKVGGTTEMIEVQRANGRFSAYSLGDAAIVHEIAEQYDSFLDEQKKASK